MMMELCHGAKSLATNCSEKKATTIIIIITTTTTTIIIIIIIIKRRRQKNMGMIPSPLGPLHSRGQRLTDSCSSTPSCEVSPDCNVVMTIGYVPNRAHGGFFFFKSARVGLKTSVGFCRAGIEEAAASHLCVAESRDIW
jgi:hypothetical protein